MELGSMSVRPTNAAAGGDCDGDSEEVEDKVLRPVQRRGSETNIQNVSGNQEDDGLGRDGLRDRQDS